MIMYANCQILDKPLLVNVSSSLIFFGKHSPMSQHFENKLIILQVDEGNDLMLSRIFACCCSIIDWSLAWVDGTLWVVLYCQWDLAHRFIYSPDLSCINGIPGGKNCGILSRSLLLLRFIMSHLFLGFATVRSFTFALASRFRRPSFFHFGESFQTIIEFFWLFQVFFPIEVLISLTLLSKVSLMCILNMLISAYSSLSHLSWEWHSSWIVLRIVFRLSDSDLKVWLFNLRWALAAQCTWDHVLNKSKEDFRF